MDANATWYASPQLYLRTQQNLFYVASRSRTSCMDSLLFCLNNCQNGYFECFLCGKRWSLGMDIPLSFNLGSPFLLWLPFLKELIFTILYLWVTSTQKYLLLLHFDGVCVTGLIRASK